MYTRLGFAAMLLAALGMATSLSARELPDAMMKGDLRTVQNLLASGADASQAQPDGATALHWAVYRQDVAAVRALVEAGADANAANAAGMTPLALANEAGIPAIIGQLLEAGADPNEKLLNGETALMMAARTGNVEAMELLLQHGAEIDARENLRGTTPLMWAAAYGNAPAVALLLEHGADKHAQSATAPLGRRPYLAPTARARITEFLRGDGFQFAITVNLEGEGERVEEQRTEEVELDLPVVDENEPPDPSRDPRIGGGLTPLVFAARVGDLRTVQTLVEAGADINQVTEYGWTPLLAAINNRYYRLADYLLDQGADPNIQNTGGWNTLYLATKNRNIEGGDYPTRRPDMDDMVLIRKLLDLGADPNMRMASSTETRTIFTHQWLYEEGATPFLRASMSGDLELMELLLEHGADPLIPTEHGVTPLHVASGIGWVEGVTNERSRAQTLEAVKLLIDLGNDVNAQDWVDLRTPLMGAAHKGRPEIIQVLYEHGADLATRDIGSRDTLHSLAGVTWIALDYSEGLVRVGVQSATPQPEANALLRELMAAEGHELPPENRTLDTICVTPELCQ
jgi:uncharacterized protein